jgi:hypothetical protein
LAVNRQEAKLIMSEAFQGFAPPSLLEGLELQGSDPGPPDRLAAPHHGRELVKVLKDFAAAPGADPNEAVVAVALAERAESVLRRR